MKFYFYLMVLTVLLVGCERAQEPQESTTEDEEDKFVIMSRNYRRRPRDPNEPVYKAYQEARKSIQGCEKFISQYPDERDLCARAQLCIASLYSRRGQKEQAIKAYQKAIDQYGEVIFPYLSAPFRVKDSALFHMGLCYKDMGQRDKAMEIFDNLTREAWDSNTKTAARTRYLETKQSHLKIKLTVSVPDKKTYAVGENIPVSVLIENNTEETVVFKCYAKMQMLTYRVTAPREGSEELTLLAGAKCEEALIFTVIDTKGLIPGEYEVTGGLAGISFATNCVMVQMVSGK